MSVKDSKLYQEIRSYMPSDEREACDKAVILGFMEKNEDVFSRENKIAHMTTSAWIINKERTKVLMIYHNIYNSWAWMGGHADGEKDLFLVCKKEVEEESGLKNLVPLKEGIFALNILTVNPHVKRGQFVNAHLHFDVEYLFEADEREAVRMKEDENSGVAWVEIEKINEAVTEEHMKPIYARLMEKIEA